MTTTLRPTEPLQRAADGSLSRRYQVCVNGRPVGRVHLATDPVRGPGVARLRELWIDEADRHRGRGAVAALAAEEAARAWGCGTLTASVPETSVPALRLMAALGYTPVAREAAQGTCGEAGAEGDSVTLEKRLL
ncbi:GNAT family N-acetyltransferase [Streptomyces sp. NA04227]|nr:GNAT family N-acetyltransferase [Streptomyces sp. NA04227]